MNNAAQAGRLGEGPTGRLHCWLPAMPKMALNLNRPVDASSKAGSNSRMKSNFPAQLQRTVTRSILLLWGASCTACAQPSGPPTAAASAPQASALTSPQLLQAIRDEVGEAACDSDRQCFGVGVGWKACGGPETYLAWSSKSGNRDRLLERVTQHRDARKKEHERSGMASDCRVLPDPGAVCRPRAPDGKRVCQAGQGGQGRLD